LTYRAPYFLIPDRFKTKQGFKGNAMSIANATTTLPATNSMLDSKQMPYFGQVFMLTKRYVVTVFRTPAAIIPSLIISVFFLAVYQASLGGAANFLPGLAGKSYLGFILPVSVVSAALSGAGVAGQAVVRDITTGYFDKLMLTPVSRSALLLGSILAGAIVLGIQATLVTVVGVLTGLQPATGVLGIVAIIAMALGIGTAFAGFTVGIGLRTGNPAATQGASFLFFPLTFLTATFVPVSLLSGWLKTAAQYNPITYILEAQRAILNDGWVTDVILRGVGSTVILALFTFAFAWSGLRARTQRK
jgi:ABC-2 type transport system permease protein